VGKNVGLFEDVEDHIPADDYSFTHSGLKGTLRKRELSCTWTFCKAAPLNSGGPEIESSRGKTINQYDFVCMQK
jgi:hypothetical protein